jgi:thioredoxin-related protein
LLENIEQDNELLKLKAPTIDELSYALKQRVGDRANDEESHKFEIEDFIGEYLSSPDLNRSILPYDIKSLYKTMPKLILSDDELEAVSEFIYYYSEDMIKKLSVKRYSLKKAFKKAKEKNKIILIEGFLPYCKGCIKMDREVFVDEDVKKALDKDFVFTKINALTQKFPLGIKSMGTPSYYFIDSSGTKVLKKIHGTGDKKEFLELLKSVKNIKIK